ncbi:MAG: aldehyde dehydrogenase family protein [Proteobacteria bacterium]|nr:aldehyde dehydrogenase family protein [Pseudomonadota bacterium]
MTEIDAIIARARAAQKAFEAKAVAAGNQTQFDLASKAVAWALMHPQRNAQLAEMAVAKTGLGNVADKINKNHRKTLGLLRDLEGVKTFGHISDDKDKGISVYLRPKGVVAAIVPSTNPLATPTNNAVNALKTGNAIIFAPSPKGADPMAALLAYMHAELKKIGADPDLVQMLPNPPSKDKTASLMAGADVLVVTGSQNNVRAAYASGTPCIGVGMGNVATIIDETADLTVAAEKIAVSKCFDNATSCSCENAVIVVEGVYEAVKTALAKSGGYILSPQQTTQLESLYWQDGKMNRDLMAKDVTHLIKALRITDAGDEVSFLVAPTDKAGLPHKISGEKLACFFALYKAKDFDAALSLAITIQHGQGAGHSIGLHSADDSRAHAIAAIAPTCRVIVNQAHCFGTGGSFDNGLPFSLSMGCGSWGGNGIDDNFNWTHLVNHTRIARPIAEATPSVESLLGDYWQASGHKPNG